MNIKQKILCTVYGYYPMIAFAEVSDKVQSIPSALLLGVLTGCGMIFLGRFRWWLNVLLLPIPILLIVENISLWNESAMREALIHEQGLIYFGALGIQDFLILTGAIVGIVFGYKRSR
jgi:hypothetical protein